MLIEEQKEEQKTKSGPGTVVNKEKEEKLFLDLSLFIPPASSFHPVVSPRVPLFCCALFFAKASFSSFTSCLTSVSRLSDTLCM